MFKTRTNPTTTVNVIKALVPSVLISPTALIKMQLYTANCDTEVGWLGTAIKKKDEIYITDTHLFEQEVHSTTTEINADALLKFGEEVLRQENGTQIWNNVKVWGHSHVNMAVMPSGQDNDQMEEFANGGHEWFIRLICNKHGEMKVDIYDFVTGVIYLDAPWTNAYSKREVEILAQIEKLEKIIQDEREEMEEELSKLTKEEIKEKVKEKVVKLPTPPSGKAYGIYEDDDDEDPYRGYVYKANVVIPIEQKKKPESNAKQSVQQSEKREEEEKNKFDNVEAEAWQLFSWAQLIEFGYCIDVDELEAELWEQGWKLHFSQKDIRELLYYSQSLMQHTEV